MSSGFDARALRRVPPFFATELVAFMKSDLRAVVRYLSPNPPGKDEIKILEAFD